MRLGRAAGELEREQKARAKLLRELVLNEVVDVPSVRAALATHRGSGSGPRVH